jgi:hypothetical protein
MTAGFVRATGAVPAYYNRRNAGSPRTVPERQRVDTARAEGHAGATASVVAIWVEGLL